MKTTRKRTRGILFLPSLVLLSSSAVGAQQFPPDEDLKVMLRYLVEDGEAPGIVLGILEADGSTRIISHGSAGPNTRPLGPRSVFEIGSINKTFTGALLADMVARGKVALSDPVSKYLPASVRVPSRGGRQITLLDLATHHSGLPRLPDNHSPADPANPYSDYTVAKLYAFLSSHELQREPGAKGEYSNLGMGLLGHALARAAGVSYQELVRERILKPIGMRTTGWAVEGALAEWTTKGHNDAGQVVPFWFGTEAIYGAGGLRSNLEDMLAYLKANVGPADTGLERAMRDAHQVRQQLDGNSSIGLGWQVADYQGRKIVTHGGGTGGYRTQIAFDPEKRVGFVMLTNSGRFKDDIGMDFLRRGPPLAIREAPVSREILKSYVGEYQVAPGSSMVVKLEDDGTLTVRAPNNVRFRMYAESDAKFFLKRTPWRFTFTRDASGAVAGFIVNMNGTDRTARKVSSAEPHPGPGGQGEVRDLPLTAADIALYEGTYRLQAGARTIELRVFGEDGQLKAQPTGQSVTRLRSQGDHAFTAEVGNGIRLVFTLENGRAEGVTLHQNGRALPGKRKP
jgi:CubicO group peptidase (beta-lactamase class C family)